MCDLGCGRGLQNCLWVGEADVLGRQNAQPASDEEWIGAAFDHPGQPVECSACVGVAHRLDQGGDEVVVVFALSIVGEGARPSASTRIGSVTGRLPSAAGDVAVRASSSAESATRASPPAQRASLAIKLDSTRGLLRARPRSGSSSARNRIVVMSSAVSGSRTTTRQRERSAELTSNDGFSVVAPINVIVPSSTAPEQCVLLTLVEAMNLVDEKNRSLAALLAFTGLFDRSSDVFHSGQDGRDCDKLRAVAGSDQPRKRCLARARRAPEDER